MQATRIDTRPGAFRVGPEQQHIVRLHLGSPVRVHCKRPMVRLRDHLDVMPAGMEEAWFEEDASSQLEVRVDAAEVAQVAADLDLAPCVQPRFHAHDECLTHLAKALFVSREPLLTDAIGHALIVRLLGAPAPANEPMDRGALSRAQRERLREWIDANLAGDVSLRQLARVAGVGISQLKVLFKRTFGVTPHAFVIARRVEHAQRLLAETDASVAAIALDVGFAHQSHLARWMRRLTGTPPRRRSRSVTRDGSR